MPKWKFKTMLIDKLLRMIKIERILVLFLFTTLSLLHSCGVKDDVPEGLEVYDLGNLETSCKLDTEKLAKILEQEIGKEINCLETSINQFTQFVKRENQNFIKLDELQKFIVKFFPGQADLAKDILSLVFDLNSLILRDPQKKISVSKLPSIFNLFRIVNSEGKELYHLIKGLDKNNYWPRRQAMFSTIERLAQKVLVLARAQTSYSQSLSIRSFLNVVKESLKLNDDQLNIEKIESFLFVKKLILGGPKLTISSLEAEELFSKAGNLAMLGLDAFFVKGKNFESEIDKHYFYYDLVSELMNNYYDWSLDEPMFNHQDVLNILDTLLSDDYRSSEFDSAVKAVKTKVIGGDPEQYRFRDLFKVTEWGMELTGSLYFNDVTFEHYKSLLNSPEAIKSIEMPNLDAYSAFPKSLTKKLWNMFEYISLNFRYFHDQEGFTHYYSQYQRYINGFNNATLIRWGLTKIIQTYGHFPEGKRRKEADTEDVRRLLFDVEKAAKEIGLWPNDVERFISEAVNSSDLFQYHSDGNGTSSVEELTEYVVNVLSSNEISKKIHPKLAAICGLTGDDGESIDIPCYREYFLHIFFEELKLNRYYSKLNDYVNLNGKDEAQQYLKNIELYARIIPDDNLPLTKEDLTRLIVTLSNIESAFIRHDVNRDGVLDYNELGQAFLVFKNLIVQVSGASLSDSMYKSIFLYLIKEMEVPKTTQLLYFHFFKKKKDITSTRFNISAILSNFVLK